MSANIVWDIDYMNSSTQTINGFTSVVVTAGWRCNGSEANTATPPVTFTTSVYGTATFTPPPAGDPNFIAYANLTQAEVLNWVWASGVDKASAEAAVNSNLNALINPPVVQNPLPWATKV